MLITDMLLKSARLNPPYKYIFFPTVLIDAPIDITFPTFWGCRIYFANQPTKFKFLNFFWLKHHEKIIIFLF